MIKGLYTAAAGMLATTIATDTMANNMANVNTTGFKQSKVDFQTFPQMLMHRMTAGGGTQAIGKISTGSQVYGTSVNYAQGPMSETGNTFDLALDGDGFFTIKHAGSSHLSYTRAGNFTVNDQGYLVTEHGDFVQGRLGNILLSLDKGPYTISAAGDIKAKDRLIDQLKIARFSDNNMLQKLGDNLYTAGSGAKLLPEPSNHAATPYKLCQGKLEQSNTNIIAEMVNNIQGMRLYEALQKNIHMHNETLGKAVNEVGRNR